MACAPSEDSDQPGHPPSLGIRPVWSESLFSAWRRFESLATHWAHSKDSDQNGRMPRLIWVFAGCTYHFVEFCHVAAQMNDNRSTAAYSTREQILYTVCCFLFSYVGTDKPTKTLCVTVHAPMTSLKVSIINFISWTKSWLLKVFYAISVTRALSRTSWMFVVKQVPVCSSIWLIFACVVLRKVHVHSKLFPLGLYSSCPGAIYMY